MTKVECGGRRHPLNRTKHIHSMHIPRQTDRLTDRYTHTADTFSPFNSPVCLNHCYKVLVGSFPYLSYQGLILLLPPPLTAHSQMSSHSLLDGRYHELGVESNETS